MRIVSKILGATISMLIASAATTSSLSAFQGSPAFPPAQVEVAVASERMMAPQLDVSGTVISINDSRISSEVEGVLNWIADVGTPVIEGDVIGRVDARLMKIANDQAKANLKRLEADMVFRNQEVARFQELSATNNASKARLSEVIARRDMLAQEIVQARVNLERAKGDLARTEIRAPFGGHVVTRLANKGEYINTGTEIIRLVDTLNREVVLPAPLAVIPHLNISETVNVKSTVGEFDLPIRTVVPAGDPTSRMVEVRLSVSNQPWIVGTPVKISLPKDAPVRAVAVPRDALVLKGSSMFVFRITDDNKAEQIRADIGATVGLWVAISSGVNAGDKIVIRGAERLQPGQDVIVNSDG